MNLYKNSGSHGDLIYSLCVIPKLGAGDFIFPISNLANEVARYHPRHMVDLMTIHRDYFTEEHYEMFLPLLEAQPYINKVIKWDPNTPIPEGTLYDTDRFRKIFGKNLCNNYMTMFYSLFNIPFNKEDHNVPWLTAGKNQQAPIVICRTERYRFRDNHANEYYQALDKRLNFKDNAIFIGSTKEHINFQVETGITIPKQEIANFLHFAELINGAELFVGNQTFGLALATALGKYTHTEIRPGMPHPAYNECFWEFRNNSVYF